jgi:hypothetical protein
MPCRDWDDRPSNSELNELHQQNAKTEKEKREVERALCSALAFIENARLVEDYFDRTDWSEQAISADFVRRWWREHKAEDDARRKREAAAKAAKQAKEARQNARSKLAKEALAKLSDDEREALGLLSKNNS